MKVVVSCDAIVARDYATSVVESVLSLYEDAEIYTIVHKVGAVLGPIEQRRIQSSYLSNVIDDQHAMGESWWKKSFLIPGACRNLTIPCSVDVVINISSGFSQGIARCAGVYQITYLVENSFQARVKRSFLEKIFSGFVENWAKKKMGQADQLWVTNGKELDFWSGHHSNVSVMPPFFKASDFPLFPSAIRKSFPNDFFCFDSPSITPEQADSLIEKCTELKVKFKFVGRDEHLVEKVSSENRENFFGDRCSGELAPLLAASRGFISLEKKGFPCRSLNALSTGTPVAMLTESDGLAFFDKNKKEGVFNFDSFESLLSGIGGLFQGMENLDPGDLHNQTNSFHDLRFRGEFVRRMKSVAALIQEKSDSLRNES